MEAIPLLHHITDREGVDLAVLSFDSRNGEAGPLTPNRHRFYEVLLLDRGAGIHMIDFQPCPMAAAMAYPLTPGQVHYWAPSGPVKGWAVRFTPACFPSPCLPEKLGLFHTGEPVALALEPEAWGRTVSLLERLEEELKEERPLGRECAESLLILFLAELERAAGRGAGERPSGFAGLAGELVRFHESRGWNTVTVEEAAKALGVGEDRLNREVKEAAGMSAGAFLRSRTALEAKRLLAYLATPAAEVGAALGFEDPAYFSRFFKRETGVSPTKFREKYQR